MVGLMLGTTIIAAALTTGDTMSHTIRTTAVATLGATDETIAPKGAVDDIPGALGAASGTGWVAESGGRAASRRPRAGSASSTASPERSSSKSRSRRRLQGQNEPSVVLFAADPARMDGFSPIRGSRGAALSLGDLRPREVYLNARAARDLRVEAGDRVVVYAGAPTVYRCACATSSGSTEPARPTPPC